VDGSTDDRAPDGLQAARAVVVLHREADDVVLGPVYGGRCDLAFVEDLLRVQLAARRFGWSIHLCDVRPDLVELLELAGLSDEMAGCGRVSAS
jgi:hypothetical protein